MTEGKPGSTLRKMKFLKLLFKVAITLACLWYVSTRIDFDELGSILLRTNWWLLLGAAIVFVISKIIASLRLNIYFRNIGLQLKETDNLKLFWLGMFYNLFLPGSITGDAYKVILLSKKFDIAYRRTTSAVMLDRFSGLLALGILLSVYAFFSIDSTVYSTLLIAAAIAAVFFTLLIVRRYFPAFMPGFWPTFFLGLAVQALMILCIYAIIYSLGITTGQTQYVFTFLVAAVAGVLPLTVGGGLGIREFVFYQGAIYLGLNEHTAVIISLLFYFVTLITSLFGAVYIFRPVFSDSSMVSKKMELNNQL